MGVFYILVSGAAFGLLPWFARVAYDHGAEPFGMLAARFVFASAVMVLIRYTKKRREPRPEKKLELSLFLKLLGGFGISTDDLLGSDRFTIMQLGRKGLVP